MTTISAMMGVAARNDDERGAMIELDDLDASEGDDDGAGLSWARARDLAALEGPNRPPPPVDCPPFICCLLPCLSSLPSMRAYARAVPEDALVMRDDAWTDVDARDVVRGDLVLVRDGESAPADFVVRSCDDFEVSLKHVTGETAPKRPKPGDEVYLGAVVLRGSAQGRVVAIGAETALAQRIAEGAWPPR
mmetsp:Transcript_3524/g.10638  ORF Transcript_3524/g.10638 Transcript_3524/m.10638 type:complete len:191 (-) Transcript_3524:41-613(-)